MILSIKPLAFIGEAKQCRARRCQCLAKLFALAEKHFPVFTPIGLIAGASLLVQCEALRRQTYIFIKIALHLPCEMHKGSEPRQIFNFSLDNALAAMLNSLSRTHTYTHTRTLPCPLPACLTPQGQKQSDFSDSHGGYLEARPLHLQEMPEPVQTQRRRENAYICINYLRLKERQGQLVVTIHSVCMCVCVNGAPLAV